MAIAYGETMTLHLMKLCVGVGSIEELAERQRRVLERSSGGGKADGARLVHTTRMTPKRRDALLDGGSLYWVIGGVIRVRQRLVDIAPFTDGAGVRRCHLVLDPELVPTRPQRRRPFQGWRYLEPADAPPDLDRGTAVSGDLPPEMAAELAELGLL